MTESLDAADTRLSETPEIWDPRSPALAAVFDAVPDAIGVPGVHLCWRLLANNASRLAAIWPLLEAALRSDELRRSAARLQRSAFIEEAVGLPSHKAFRGDLARAEIDAELREKIENFNATSQMALSRLLVAMAVARRGDPASVAPHGWGPAADADDAPAGVYVPPLRDNEARGKAIEVLMRVRQGHGLPFVDDYLRSLARIPDYLSAAWNAIVPLVGDPEYVARANQLGEEAAVAANGLIGRPTAAAPDPFGGLLNFLVDRLLPQALLDVTLIRALTSGPDRAVD